LTSEADKASQKADLEDQIKTVNSNLEERKAEVTKLQQQLQQVCISPYNNHVLYT